MVSVKLWAAAKRLKRKIERERRRQERVEADRQRDGGVHDPILKRWVPKDE